MINTYLYSVYGSAPAQTQDIADYRHGWLNAIHDQNDLDAIVSLGGQADRAYHTWITQAAPAGASAIAYQHITHPTAAESGAASGQGSYASLVKALLENWNTGLQALHPQISHPDTPTPLALYGDSFQPSDDVAIPPGDLPAGLPAGCEASSPGPTALAPPPTPNAPPSPSRSPRTTAPGTPRQAEMRVQSPNGPRSGTGTRVSAPPPPDVWGVWQGDRPVDDPRAGERRAGRDDHAGSEHVALLHADTCRFSPRRLVLATVSGA